MKKMIIMALAGLISLVASATTTLNYSSLSFDGLDVSNVFKVTLVKADACSATVEASDELTKYVKVEAKNGILCLKLENVPEAITRNLGKNNKLVLNATVCMPVLNTLYMSGASKLFTEDVFTSTGTRFRMSLSGASKAEGLQVTGGKAGISLSGAAKADFGGTFGKTNLSVSGASKLNGELSSGEMDLEAAGASKVNLDGTCQQLKIEVSGASKVAINGTGTADSVDAEVSGASKLDLENCKANTVVVEVSGTSNCRVWAEKSLSIEASGVSSCYYHAAPGAPLTIRAARMSNIKEL